MQNLFLEKNPFYILEVSPWDKRTDIVAKSEEKAFFTDAAMCEDAQIKLLNPQKRLSAELDWFCDLSPNEVSQINSCINNKKLINTNNLTNISKLNATLYNFSISHLEDCFNLENTIVNIDSQYTNINQKTLIRVLNTCRSHAGMRQISQEEFELEFSKKREQIRHHITDKLNTLHANDYINLVTIISDKYISNPSYNDGIILSDIINQYEIKFKSTIDEATKEIFCQIEKIKTLSDSEELKPKLYALINCVKIWDKLVQPLQINTNAKGMRDDISEDVSIQLRNLAIYLHNEKNETGLALELCNTLKIYFAEVQLPFDLENDLNTLENFKREDEHAKHLEAEALKRNREDKSYQITVYNSSYASPPLCTCCMKPTQDTEKIDCSLLDNQARATRTITCELPLCEECLEHRNKFSNEVLRLCGYSILIGAVTMAISSLTFETGYNSFVLGGIVAILCYIVLSLILKTKDLPSNHATRNESVSISAFYSNDDKCHISFTFKNWQYANLFRMANAQNSSEIKEIKSKNNTKGATFANTYDSFVKTGFMMLVSYAIAAIFVAIALVGIRYCTGVLFDKPQSSYEYSSSSASSSYNSNSSSASSAPSIPSSSYSKELPFSQNLSSGMSVYADIVSIFPEVGIYTQGSSYYSSFVCKCETSTGNTIWVHMPVSEYRINFDSSVSSDIHVEYAEEVTFSSSKKIHGTVKTSNSVLSGLSMDIGAEKLIEFSYIN